MSLDSLFSRWDRAATRILRIVARTVRVAQGEHGVVMKTNRGYGSRDEIFMIGRVFRQSRPHRGADDSLIHQLRDIGRRISRRAVPGVAVTAEFGGTQQQVSTDRDGYFRIHLRPRDRPPPNRLWHVVHLILERPLPVRAEGQVFIPPEHYRFVVISDIDDTVVKTGVANKLKMLWRLFVEDAESRTAFPGVAALYRALHAGASGDEANPMLYVSRAPWGIYEVLDEFFTRHAIPVGPILFLREWGVSWTSPLPRRAEDHKRELIRRMLALYHELPFVLIGDSGQRDPEGYRQVVDENPGRVLAVYIRNVSHGSRRIKEIEELAKAVAAAGSSLVLAADSSAIADHAAKLGLIDPAAVTTVASEEAAEGGSRTRVRTLHTETSEGELRDVLGSDPGGEPPNVVVEPDKPQG
ncbi:App1 family protein [Microvirga sp. M2]|uniref:App1 family protein n=1 Tax=Microvirga sp. M2 TaxID=3073270 RepID=UPI0039C1A9D2